MKPTPCWLLLALGLGVACGQAVRSSGRSLPEAGSSRDDGSGLLARASAGLATGAGAGYGNASYTTGTWGGYGGNGYGAAAYGGGVYARYRFERRSVRDADVARYDPSYVVTDKLKTGHIRGTVRWSARPARVRPPMSGSCADTTDIGSDPADAIVFLRKISRGRGFPKLDNYTSRLIGRGGQLRVHRCRLDPRVQVVGPIGSALVAQLEHPGPDRLRGAAPLVLDISLSSRGDHRFARLEKPGPVEVVSASGASAWLYVAGHPYHVTVDAAGAFVLLDVPAGRYELVAWHPPVTVNGARSAPLTTSVRVVVSEGRTSTARLRLRAPARRTR